MATSYQGILPDEVLRWGQYLFRKYHRYCDSTEDYWQTVALVWLRCQRNIDPAYKPYHYFVRSFSRELWRLGARRLRLPNSLPDYASEVISTRLVCSEYPESLKELVADFSVVRRDLEEMSHELRCSTNSASLE